MERQLAQVRTAGLAGVGESAAHIEPAAGRLGNYIAVNDAPNDMFGKVMSLPDALIGRYFTLLTDVPEKEIRGFEMEMHWGSVNPRDIKAQLGREIVTFFYGAEAAVAAEAEFRNVFSNKELPADMPVASIPAAEIDADGKIVPVNLVFIAGLAETKSDARRLIRQKAVTIDGVLVTDEKAPVAIKSGQVLKVGKRRFSTLDIGG